MEAKSTATDILKSIESIVDPNAPVEQQLAQMREQITALAELPKLINEKLESVNKKISQICIQKESTKKEVVQEQIKEQQQIKKVEMKKQKETQQSHQYYQLQFQKHIEEQNEKRKQQQLKQQQMQQQQQLKLQQQQLKQQMQQEEQLQQQQQQQMQQQKIENNSANPKDSVGIMEVEPEEEPSIQIRLTKPSLTGEELLDAVQREELRRSLEDLRMRKSASPGKDQASQTSQRELRLARGKPEPAFGPGPIERPLYLPGGKLWKMSEYDEDQITETLVGQAEVIKGHALGVNFKKFEKPPPGVDHLKHSEVFRAVHNLEEAPLKKVQMLRPTAFAESEIRERVRSMSPANPAETR